MGPLRRYQKLQKTFSRQIKTLKFNQHSKNSFNVVCNSSTFRIAISRLFIKVFRGAKGQTDLWTLLCPESNYEAQEKRIDRSTWRWSHNWHLLGGRKEGRKVEEDERYSIIKLWSDLLLKSSAFVSDVSSTDHQNYWQITSYQERTVWAQVAAKTCQKRRHVWHIVRKKNVSSDMS